MSAPQAVEPQNDGELTHKQIMTILTGLLLGMFLAGARQLLTLANPTTIREGAMSINVANAVVNFHSGEITTGRIKGTM